MIDCLSSHLLFYACFVAALLLSLIPILGKFINVVNTLIHESAHAIVSLLSSGEVVHVKLSADASGAAQTKSKYWLGKVLTSLAGYLGSSLAAWLLFYLVLHNKYTWVYYLLFALILVNLTLWVRNTFGIIWLLVFGTLSGFVYWYSNADYMYYFAVFISFVVLINSVSTAITLLYISIKTPGKSGDAKNLSDFTLIPSLIWALLFVGFSVFVAYKVIQMMPCLASLSTI